MVELDLSEKNLHYTIITVQQIHDNDVIVISIETGK